MKINILTANPFQVNTYLISNDQNETIIIDPACSNVEEENYFVSEINALGLNPKMILLTHGHIDHILGCGFMSDHYGIDVYAHHLTEFFIAQVHDSADLFGLNIRHIPKINHYLEHGQSTGIQGVKFDVMHTPGHASGSLCFYSEKEHVLFSGDVLFQQSIGRTDLPTGDMDTLLYHINEFLLVLPPQTIVYPGHGPSTTIKHEIHHNPFLIH